MVLGAFPQVILKPLEVPPVSVSWQHLLNPSGHCSAVVGVHVGLVHSDK